MKLQDLFLSLLQVELAKSIVEVTGYIGESITLPSGVDPSWQIFSVEWAIMSNHTWIATYRNGTENIDRFWRYKGRLSLNVSSGDLVIRDLTKEDAIEYNTETKTRRKKSINQKVKLTVKQHLRKPSIQKLFSTFEERGCWMVLQCSSPDEGVSFFWEVHPSSSALINISHSANNASVIFALVNTTHDVSFICTTSKKMENVSSVMTEKCHDDTPKPEATHIFAHGIYLGIFLGIVLSLIIYFLRDQIKAAFEYLKNKLCLSKEL